MPERFKLPVGIFIVLRKNDEVLLQLRKNCSFAGNYGFVGGHLDGNEEIVWAGIREAREEIGVIINPDDLMLKTICHSNKGEEYLQFYFECKKWDGVVKNMEPNKCEKIEWVKWNDLPNNTCPYLKQAIKMIDNGVKFYEDKF